MLKKNLFDKITKNKFSNDCKTFKGLKTVNRKEH